ncbi:MAG TPA: anaerobic ribonucleoside-triphosphate reductase [Candidatus Avacidaminococcus intestinavium]|uniref:Anaerobic ribonucleoside-triphosphate reductase n=1 Tax=Candidatus Avacidaminococcus intestinavium TaxID=2840684 RepID=A0A9D1MNF5_9FIRM|nr:anaerobic ribonucleoside-triphosphate reductase [Candidatus Avacidaminococcus intestinavium]
MVIRKRDGREVPFDDTKITDAIFEAAKSVGGADRQMAMEVTLDVLKYVKANYTGTITVEQVQDVVEKILIENGHAKTAKSYILYRAQRTGIRNARSELMDTVGEILKETDRDNANISNSPSAKMLQIASAASREYYLNRLIPKHMADAHRRGDFHIHDLDFYGKTLNCLNIPLGRLLKTGFNNGHGFIRPPRRPTSAAALAAIILQSSQNDMFGGQSFGFFDYDMAPFMEGEDEETVFQAMEALIYNLNSMHSRAGAQVPFSSLNLGLDTSEGGRKVIRNVLKAYDCGLGRGENPIFPNVIFRLKKGINMDKGDPNYDLFQLAIAVAAKRMNPTFSFMDSSFNKQYDGDVAYMGCRTRVISNRRGAEVTSGRGNISFTTINLPRLAIKAEHDIMAFYQELDEMINLVAEQLYHRFKVVANLKVGDLPFLMGQGLYLGSETLENNEKIETAIVNGTLSLGFIGLAETLIALVGKHHGESEEALILGEEIVAFMRDKMDKMSDKYDLNYTLIATPAEGLSGRFVRMDRKEYGIIPGVTDKAYYTNSFHIPVGYEISAYDKIGIEGKFHKYTNAGHISYVEFTSSPVNNTEAVEDVLKYMCACDCGYVGINFPIDYCDQCGYTGIIDGDYCPKCDVELAHERSRIT